MEDFCEACHYRLSQPWYFQGEEDGQTRSADASALNYETGHQLLRNEHPTCLWQACYNLCTSSRHCPFPQCFPMFLSLANCSANSGLILAISAISLRKSCVCSAWRMFSSRSSFSILARLSIALMRTLGSLPLASRDRICFASSIVTAV